MYTPTEYSSSDNTDLQLAQVDPPHPFKSAWKTVAIAAILVTLALAIFVFFIHRPPEATGQIVAVNYYPVHSTESGSGGAAGMQGDTVPYDQLIILAKVQVRNQTDIPLFLQDISAQVTLPDGSTLSSIGAGSQDFDRIFRAFPSLASLRSQPFDRSATLNSGDIQEGLTAFSFPFTQAQWNSRKSGAVLISFLHGKSLTLPFPQ